MKLFFQYDIQFDNCFSHVKDHKYINKALLYLFVLIWSHKCLTPKVNIKLVTIYTMILNFCLVKGNALTESDTF